MEKKKLKKLSINKMSEFPMIGEQEQIEMKGGNPTILPWLIPMLVELCLDYTLSSGDGSDPDGGNYGGSGNVIIQLGGSNNSVSINGTEYSVSDSIYIEAADSISGGTIYQPTGITIY